MKPAVFILAIALAGCAAGGERYESAAAPAEADEAAMEEPSAGSAGPAKSEQARRVPAGSVDIFIDCGEEELAAYTIELRFNPSIARVMRVESADGGGFPGAPMSDPQSYGTGVTRIVALHAGGGLAKGRVPVARVVFDPVSSGSSPISVSILSLYNPQGRRVIGAAILSRHSIVVSGLAGDPGEKR